MTIVQNQHAIAILAHAVEQLQAIGLNCLISPVSLPQGASISLQVADTIEAVLAANVATHRGSQIAHDPVGASGFAEDVAEALTEATILKAAHVHPSNG